MTPRAPVKYVLTEKAAVTAPDGNCTVREAGSEIEYAGLPSANMTPLCSEGVKRRAEAIEYDKKGRFETATPIEVPSQAEREAAAAAAEIAAKIAKLVPPVAVVVPATTDPAAGQDASGSGVKPVESDLA